MAKSIDLTGERFGRLVAVRAVPGTKNRSRRWLCLCDCGNETAVITNLLMSGQTRSCGCLRNENTGTRSTTHGYTKGRKEHPLYSTWLKIRSRCFVPRDPAYRNYGGRGITVCRRWSDFANFVEDMGERPGPEYTVERVNNDLGYSPDNCVWASRLAQSRNTRRNVLLTHDGKTMSVVEWAAIVDIPYFTIISRLKRGWSTDRALTEPVDTSKRNKLAKTQ